MNQPFIIVGIFLWLPRSYALRWCCGGGVCGWLHGEMVMLRVFPLAACLSMYMCAQGEPLHLPTCAAPFNQGREGSAFFGGQNSLYCVMAYRRLPMACLLSGVLPSQVSLVLRQTAELDKGFDYQASLHLFYFMCLLCPLLSIFTNLSYKALSI
jgi:hypothetical protein